MENLYYKPKRDTAITLLHVVGMIMIFLCHSMQIEKIYSISEILISGVPLFLFVSGFLTGKKEIDNVGKWLIEKAKRILVPFLIFIITIYGLYSISGMAQVSAFQWIFSLCNLQGLNYTYWKFNHFGAVAGCGHLWFVTTLMFCYLLTPLMQKLKKRSLKSWQKFLLILSVLIGQLGLLYLGFQLSYIITFFFGYFLSQTKIRTDFSWMGFVTLLTLTVCGARLILRSLIDGSDFYDRYFVLISSAFIGIWIFYAVYFLKAKFPILFNLFECQVIDFTERISYYFYLTHYVFLRGPLSTFGYIKNKVLAHIMAFILSYLAATIMYLVVEKALFKFFKRGKDCKI